MTKIKICGLKRTEDISYVNELLPDFAGFVFAKSSRQVDAKKAAELKIKVQDLDVKIVSQMGGLIELARMEESDILVTAIVGMIGIRPTMEAILAGKDIAPANKETLVTAGHLIMPLAKQFGVQILPVDSASRREERADT